MHSKPYKILSLSGGGARGIFQAVFLKRLEEQIGEPLWKKFDLIAGTSTGSIIALALSLGINAEKIVDLYKNNAEKIFKPKLFPGFRKGPMYKQENLRTYLTEVFQNKQLKDTKTKVLVTASCLDQFSHKVFSSFSNSSAADSDLSAVDVALSSSAAPTYFAPVKPTTKESSYLDGGLWANSPSLVAVLWANCHLSVPIESMKLISIGTGDFPKGLLSDHFVNFRKLSPTTIQTIFEIMFASQESASDTHAELLIGNDNLIRISTQLDGFIPLDDAKNAIAKLPPLADIQADNNLSRVISLLEKKIQATACRRHKLSCKLGDDHLISDELVEATGLTAFYPTRKYYTHRKSAASIDSYVNTARKSVFLISINLMTGMPFAGLCQILKEKLEAPYSNFSATISLLNPHKSDLIYAISPALDKTNDQLFQSIKETIDNLVIFRSKLAVEAQKRFDLRVHNAIPFGSAIMIDHREENGRIQIETKPYKAKLDHSFAFEVSACGESGFYVNLRTGYEELLKDGSSVEEVDLD